MGDQDWPIHFTDLVPFYIKLPIFTIRFDLLVLLICEKMRGMGF